MEEPYFYEGYELSEQVMVSFRSLDRKSQFQGGLRRRGGGTDTENISISNGSGEAIFIE